MKAHFTLKRFTGILPILLISLIVLIQCTDKPEPGTEAHIRSVISIIDDEYLANADDVPENWITYGGNYSEDRYSSLTQINKENVDQLGLVWTLNLGTKRGIEATPLVVDGIMFLTGTWSKVYAVNARNGELIWTYDPKVPRAFGEKACCDVINRGVALYKGRVFVGTLDGRLISLDAATGKSEWEVVTVDQAKHYTITGAPRIVKGNLIIGNGGAEFGVRGYVTAYDAMTGEQQWRFYTVPGDPSHPFESQAMEMAAKTWFGEWWKYGGGGTAWDAIVFDPDLNLLYVGTGNGSPWNRIHRSDGKGDNLFLSSILALNPDNGELVWHYQTTPGDNWDYTATQPLILSDMNVDGQTRKVIMQAPKNGFFYVLDRTNGKLLSAKAYTYMNWATGIDRETGRPIESTFSRYEKENVTLSPSPNGGHNWHPMAYNYETKLVYIPVQLNALAYGHDPNWEYKEKGQNVAALSNPKLPTREDNSAPENMNQGQLVAWNPRTQKKVWSVDHTAFEVNGGVMTSAGGLVFQGTADGRFVAYDAENGDKLWEYNLGAGVIAPPVTYMIDGEQYISIAVGWGGGIPSLWIKATDQISPGTIFTFRLGASESHLFDKLPPAEVINIDFSATREEINSGEALYLDNCMACHGFPGMTGGSIPNLAYSKAAIFELMEDILLKGTFLEKGMPNFSDRLNQEDVQLIKNYILHSAKNMLAEN